MVDRELIVQAMRQVAVAAEAFESRWRYTTLAMVDPELADRFHQQRNLFDAELMGEDANRLKDMRDALIRAYAAITRRMEAAGVADDAYLLGIARNGFAVAIGTAVAAAQRVRDVHGRKVWWVTPNEVATLIGGLDMLKDMRVLKEAWPTAELIDLYPNEPAKGDGAD